MRYISIVGTSFGLLTILREESKKTRSGRKKYCFCKCECGIEKWVRRSSLIDGDTKSCGCAKSKIISEKAKGRIGPRKSFAGQKFGRLTVLDEWRREQSGCGYVTKWKCICECGVEKWIQTSSLKRIRSCGCFHKEQMSVMRRLQPGQAAFNSIFSGYKVRAAKKEICFDLSKKEFKYLTKQKCFYCGIKCSNFKIAEGKNGSFIYNGIDRQDNTKGYTVDNCVSCCKVCNKAKDIMSCVEFLNWVKRVYSHNVA